jgi:hypothetical protein
LRQSQNLDWSAYYSGRPVSAGQETVHDGYTFGSRSSIPGDSPRLYDHSCPIAAYCTCGHCLMDYSHEAMQSITDLNWTRAVATSNNCSSKLDWVTVYSLATAHKTALHSISRKLNNSHRGRKYHQTHLHHLINPMTDHRIVHSLELPQKLTGISNYIPQI